MCREACNVPSSHNINSYSFMCVSQAATVTAKGKLGHIILEYCEYSLTSAEVWLMNSRLCFMFWCALLARSSESVNRNNSAFSVKKKKKFNSKVNLYMLYMYIYLLYLFLCLHTVCFQVSKEERCDTFILLTHIAFLLNVLPNNVRMHWWWGPIQVN